MSEQLIQGYRLSPQQRHVWRLRHADGGAAYQVSCEVRIAGGIDPKGLRAALDEVVGRHEILRTVFQGSPEVALPLQVVTSGPNVWGGEPAALDLQNGPLLRASLELLEPGSARLTLVASALVTDGAGLRHLVRELAAACAGRATDGEPLQYADFSEWQNEVLEAEETVEERAFWKGREEGASAALALPGAGSPAAVFAPRDTQAEVPGEVAVALEFLARRQGTDLGPLLLAAWQILLFRLRGETGGEVAVAAAFDGRVHPSLERLPGLFVRFLPLVSQIQGGMRLKEVLGPLVLQMEEAVRCQEAFSWPALPGGAEPFPAAAFELVDEEAGDNEALTAAGFTIERLTAVCERFAVKLTAVHRRSYLRLDLACDPSVLAAEDAERLLARYAALLSDLAARPQALVSELDLLAPADRRQLAGLVETRRDLSNDRCLQDWIVEQAARTPERIAVVSGDRCWSYAELMEQAGRIAAALVEAGVGPESRVAICMERSPEMVAGMLGVLAVGGAWVPLDPGAPGERLAYLLADARPAAVLVADALVRLLPHEAPVIPLESALSHPPAALPRGRAVPENLAYVLYTSGSTGRPKGVAMSHRAIANRLLWMQRVFPLVPEDRVLQKTPAIFDASIWELFLPLMTGARLVLAAPGSHGDPAALAAIAAAEEITVLQLVPSLLGPFLRAEADCPVPSLRRIFCGGEALPADLARRVLDRGETEIHNLYGPTECAIDATSWSCRAEDLSAPLVPIGRPIDNARVYLLSSWLIRVAPGGAGELYVGGVGLARGYGAGVERPDLTAERFLPDPFADEPGARMYRTGDLTRCRPDGALEFLGRVDQQVKVRGVRIELGEIEAVLREHPGLREAAVAVHESAPGDPRLVAYWVPAGDPAPGPGELRELLSRRLPESMVPAAFVRMSELPRMPGGKLDRRALPAPESAPLSAAAQPVATRSMTEQVVAEIWAEVLGREQVGAHDDFFELGGHSLLATQTISRLRRVFGVELSLRSLFQTPTVAELAAQVDMALGGGRGRQAPPLVPVPRDRDLPLSFAQQRLWFLDQLDPGSAAYNLALSVRLSGPLDTAAFVRSLATIVGRHEVLRTSFPATGGAPVQRISLFVSFAMPLVDLAALPASVRERETLRLAGWWARQPFDLARGPLLRALLLRTDHNEHVACLALHHIVSDGWSTALLLDELSAAYAAFTAGHAPALPPLPVQYADFASWQREWLSGEVLEEQATYWRERLGGGDLPVLELPTDRPRPIVPSLRGRRLALTLPQSLSEALAALGRQENTTLFMVLLAGFKALLHRYAGQGDVAVGTPIANRTHLEIERLIGFFVNTLVLRTRVEAGAPFRSLLAAVRETSLGAASHQDLPFEKLVEILRPERDISRAPFFQVLFVLQNAPGADLKLPGLSLAPLTADIGSSKFDLTLDLVQGRNHIRGAVEYSSDLFDEATVRRLVGHLERLLTAAAADPGARLSELPLLTPAEESQLQEWNTTAAYPSGFCLHELIEAQAARTPDRVAVTYQGEELSYRELDAAAGQLARQLARLGVGPEVVVAVCAERSLEMVVALLGVLKAGGAYLPLDPDYPADRISYMLADSGATVLLAQDHLLERLPGVDARVVRLTGAAVPPAAAASPVSLATGAGPSNLAYVIYTSGSTGRPKGVGVTHANVLRLFAATQRWFEFDDRDVWTLFHSYAFDFSVWELWGALLHGGRVVVVPYLVSRSPEDFHRLLVTEGVTVLNQTPSAFRQLVHADEGARRPAATLRLVIFGGEALEPEKLGPWFDRHGDLSPRLVNMYGITETTVHVTYRPLSAEDARSARASAIGGPIQDLSVHLLDGSGVRVPVGVPGELHVGGMGVARGYLGRPALTAERFVPDPFSAEPGARLYRSGDLARRREDGDLEYLGRIDHQIKIRGFRIELGEIEAALMGHPAVLEAVVVAREEISGDRRLVAYVVPAGESPAASDLRSFLRERLPEFMVPADFVSIDRLPLTAHGKIDRRALPAPGESRRERALVPPRNEVEEAVARIWSQVLGRTRFGVEDDFFDLGGHSLLATQVLSRLQQSFRVTIPLRSLFGAATVSELSRLLVAAEARPGQSEKIARVLNRIERMSPEEVRTMVQERNSRMSDGR